MSTTAPYRLVDIGANLGHPSYMKDLEEVIARAKSAGVEKLMVTGTSEKISQEVAKLVEREPGLLYFTAGVHPHDAKDFTETTLQTIRELQKHPQCVAVGECGLDFNRNFSPQDVQKDVFRQQVALACELRRPLFIHERDASTEMVNILGQFNDRLPPAVIHCFTGTCVEAKKYVEMGLYIGLTGFLWKDKAPDGVQTALTNGDIPLERLVIETDAPYMYPKEVKEVISEHAKKHHISSSFTRNEPASLAATCELIAAFMKKDPAEVAEATTRNAKKIYGLD